MCGRYVSPDDAAIEREWNLRGGRFPQFLRASFNLAPTQKAVIVVRSPTGEREEALMQWGLIPSWAHGIPPKYSTINATMEKLQTAPTWRTPWQRGQRCIVPAQGFYEWHVLSEGRNTKQPYFIRLKDQDVFGMAAIWDRSTSADGTTLESYAIVTVPANELMARIHNTRHRMPAILTRDTYDVWLTGTPEEAFAILKPIASEALGAHAVGTAVNSPRNNQPSLIAPLQAVASQP